MDYNKNELASIFDKEILLSEISQLYKYEVTDKKKELSVTLFAYDSKIWVRGGIEGEINFEINYIHLIKCDQNSPNFVRLLIYKINDQYPITTIYIKPEIFIVLDIEQTGKALAIPNILKIEK